MSSEAIRIESNAGKIWYLTITALGLALIGWQAASIPIDEPWATIAYLGIAWFLFGYRIYHGRTEADLARVRAQARAGLVWLGTVAPSSWGRTSRAAAATVQASVEPIATGESHVVPGMPASAWRPPTAQSTAR